MTLRTCDICGGEQDAMRDHCRFCGAKRIFIASHSYEPYQVVVKARESANMNVELVRAFQTNLAYQMVTK